MTRTALLGLLGALVAAIPVRAHADEKPPISVTYDKGLLFSDGGEFQLRLALRTQLRFEMTRPTEDDSETASRLSIPRARLQVEGHVFGKQNRYKLEFGLGDRGTFAFVRDLYVETTLGDSPVWFRIGQWKRPFNRQELVSDFGSVFNERANTAEFVGGGRDLGVAIHNDYEKSPDGVEWVLGVFNTFSGGSDRPPISTTCTAEDPAAIACTSPPPTNVPTDFRPAVVARVGWNIGGIKGYTEGDLDGGPFGLAVGASYKVDLADFEGKDAMSHGAQVDALMKVSGFDLFLGGYLMKLTTAKSRYGVTGQAGYFLLPKKAQLAARVSYAPVAGGNREELEVRGAFNWYWRGHSWKWATDFGFVQKNGEDPATMTEDDLDIQVRSMAQMTF